MTLPDDVMLPTEHERKQIFYWLKRISSYTAWNRIVGYYAAWADVAEQSVRIANDKGWSKQTGVPESDLVSILKSQASFEEGLRRLRLGDKQVFKYDANGNFATADRIPSYWSTLLHRIDIGENVIDEAHTPLWAEFKASFHQYASVNRECWPDIIESQWIGDPALTLYGQQVREQLPKMTFPDTLPAVPDPQDNVLIPTGKDIPCSGIWEPIEAPVKKGFSLFRIEDVPRGPFRPSGCMNYLHAGSAAPQASVVTPNDCPDIDVTWRLIWRDDRYENGSIPAEEADYVFVEPQAPAPEPVPEPPSTDNIVTALTGQPAPFAGRWLVQDNAFANITVNKGDILPSHEGRHVCWVLAQK